ncbi:hypothetical protein [Halogranum rubrum]|uniref:Uncharacterized protein n=1 Tax=Halogranum salarium B-1 TaxID=1210908 RepID=J2ZY53_9EURY|nr:hypothetical protein [Halogranum salarium]EJN57953.1 hypothetical protein HSB1_33700 [Halogranum salarium B-1]
MSDTLSSTTNGQDWGTQTYDNVRVDIIPQADDHYDVVVTHPDGERSRHAVERVVINSASVLFDSHIWFVDANLDVGVPIGEPGDTLWVWP